MRNKIRCLIVDDEPLSRKVIERYAADIDSLEVAGSLPGALKAIEVLREEDIDLIFLDINMPRVSGLSMLRSLEDPPAIVITTAYPEYAVEGFELDVVDYLLKPFSFERFLKSVNKVISRIGRTGEGGEAGSPDYFTVKADKKIHKISYSELLFIESKGDYLKFHCKGKSIVSLLTLKEMEKKLTFKNFLRIHRSFIVNLSHIDYMEGNLVSIHGYDVPVGSSYKDNLLRKISPESPDKATP